MNPKGCPMTTRPAKAPVIPYGMAANTSKGFTALSKLHDQSDVNQQYRDRHDDTELLKTLLLLVVFASDLEEIARRQVLLELLDLRQERRKHLRRQNTWNRERRYRHRPELIAALDF